MNEKWILKYKILALSLILGLIIGLGLGFAYYFTHKEERIEIKTETITKSIIETRTFLTTITKTINQTIIKEKTIFGIDLFGNYSIKALASYGFSKEEAGKIGRNFYLENKDLIKDSNFSKIEKDLLVYSFNPKLYFNIKDIARKDLQFNLNEDFKRNWLLNQVIKLNYIKPNLNIRRETINAIGNSTIYANLNNITQHDINTLWLLGNATQINPSIVDFEPIILKDYEGKIFVIQSQDIPRDTWMIAEHLRRTPYVVNFPEMYEAFNIKVKQNAFDIFDNLQKGEVWKLYHFVFHTNNETIWNEIIIPQWKYYWDSSPQSGNLSKRICVFPWYNSSLLKEQISNDTDRKIALMYFWELLPEVADMDEFLKTHIITRHVGLDAMKYQIQQMPKVYEKVMSKYPKGTIPWSEYNPKPTDPRTHYYGWVGDRGEHGLMNAQIQFLGFDVKDWYEKIVHQPLTEIDKYIIEHYDGINTYLSKKLCSLGFNKIHLWIRIAKFWVGYHEI
jgi:hypothetical protein